MRADFGKGGEQVPVQESRSWQSNAGRVYQERHDVFAQTASTCLPDAAPFPGPTVVALA